MACRKLPFEGLIQPEWSESQARPRLSVDSGRQFGVDRRKRGELRSQPTGPRRIVLRAKASSQVPCDLLLAGW